MICCFLMVCSTWSSITCVYYKLEIRSKDLVEIWVNHLWYIYFTDGAMFVILHPINRHTISAYPIICVSKFNDLVKVVTIRLLHSKGTFFLYLRDTLWHHETILFFNNLPANYLAPMDDPCLHQLFHGGRGDAEFWFSNYVISSTFISWYSFIKEHLSSLTEAELHFLQNGIVNA